ncbi:MAG TPA: DinB family protein [Terriglobia bacterium]|nr:DinB family protein [Terriglobia bacterium]
MSPQTAAITAPDASEYAPSYGQYIALVAGDDVVAALERQIAETVALLGGITGEQADHRYAPEKWSVKEVVGHLVDTERIFAYRALRIARGDPTPMAGFEQDDYVRAGGFGGRTLAGLLEEFAAVRRATLLLFRSFNPEAWTRRGTANQKEISVRAVAYVIAGHELHHRKILQEKYLATAGSTNP